MTNHGNNTRKYRAQSSFPARSNSSERGHFPTSDHGEDLHNSELNVVQRLCLERHDENAAIEILWKDHSSGPATSTMNHHPTTPPPVESKKIPPRNSDGGRRPTSFLNRWFRGSPHKSPPSKPPTAVVSLPQSSSSAPDDRELVPKPRPSIIRRTQSFKDLSSTVRMSNPRIRTDDFDTFSSVSSLSGSKATTVMAPRRRPLATPVRLDRRESLGTDSIMDIRNTLKVMDRQLGDLSNNGERVSRQKVMKALFTVADSLEDLEERQMIRSELQGLMNEGRQIKTQQQNTLSPLLGTIPDDVHQENKASRANTNTMASQKLDIKGVRTNSPFNLFSTVGKMFSLSNDEKKAMEQALDDLLWTEFVATRKEGESANDRSGNNKVVGSKMKPLVPRKTTTEVKQPLPPSSLSSSRVSNFREPSKPAWPIPPQNLAASWWAAPARKEDSESSGDSSSSSSSWAEDEEGLGIDDEELEGFEEGCDDSTASEDNLKYLPTSIIVGRPSAQPLSPMEQSYAFSSKERSFGSVKPRNSRYRVRMVDTESRVGFEMGSTCPSHM